MGFEGCIRIHQVEEGRKGIANGENSKAKRGRCIEHGLEVKVPSTGFGHHCLCDVSGPRSPSAHRCSASHLGPEGLAGCTAGPGGGMSSSCNTICHHAPSSAEASFKGRPGKEESDMSQSDKEAPPNPRPSTASRGQARGLSSQEVFTV